MLIILPVLSFVLLLFLFLLQTAFRPLGFRACFLAAALAWGALVVLSTEFLNASGSLNMKGIVGFWVLTNLLLMFFYLKTPTARALFQPRLSRLPPTEIFLLTSTALILVLVGLIALAAPPNTSDSLTTHMSRVVHWEQNHSLAAYPSPLTKQITFPPWTAFAILHFQILTFSDRWANMVQWFCLLGSVLGATHIARLLAPSSVGRKAQILAAAVAVSVPMGILQGSSTQNDLAVAFWLLCLAACVLHLRNEFQWILGVGAGLSLGLAFLTKGTAYIFALPFLGWFLLIAWAKYRGRGLALFCVSLLIAVCLNSGFFIRNQSFNRQAKSAGDFENTIHLNQLTPQLIVSNLVRNVALQLGTPSTALNQAVENGIIGFHRWLGADPVDPRSTYGDQPFHFWGHPFHEDHASNFLHFLIWASCLFLFFFNPELRHSSILKSFMTAVFLSFLIYGLTVKWSQYNIRHHLPLFLLAAPWMAVVLAGGPARKIASGIGALLVFAALPWVLANQSRPLAASKNVLNISRTEQYFANSPGIQYSYQGAMREVKEHSCKKIGLRMEANSWEYPLWVLLRDHNNPAIRIEHILFKEPFTSLEQPYPRGPFEPCAVIDVMNTVQPSFTLNERTFVLARQFAFARVYLPDPTGKLAAQSLQLGLNRILELYSKTLRPLETDPSQNLVLKLNLHREILGEFQKLDRAKLEKFYPGLGRAMEENLMAGLTMILEGVNAGKEETINRGNALLARWNVWLAQNTDGLKKVLTQ